MVAEYIKSHKKLCIIIAIISLIVFAAYLYALFLPGYRYGDVFLYKEKAPFDGMEVYSGHDTVNNADYEMVISKDGMNTFMSFAINETEKYYEIISDNSENYCPKVEIFENGEKIFTGTYSYYLMDENNELFEPLIKIDFDPHIKTEEELFPSYNWLYNVSQSIKPEIRGEPLFLICIVIILARTAIDMIYPDFFWETRNWFDVKGGEPSDLYRSTQKISWILTPIVVIILMIVSFVPASMFI